MATQDFKRKLAAILSADVKGYSRLMGEDEEATVRTLTTYRELIATVIQKNRGRVVDSPGDNILAEFSSVVDAVRSTVEAQEELKNRNAKLPENRRMEFRIGINLGDVIQEGERIYGDGVNVAARVESFADPGGICISRSVYDQVKNKLTLGYEYLGEHRVKNIAEPVRIYRVLMEPEAAGKVFGEKSAEAKRRRRVTLTGVVLFMVVVGSFAIWEYYLHPSTPVEVASEERMTFPLPDKPSIAVLPFENMSEDPHQDYLADGISEHIIKAFSKISEMFVIARNSTFTYKGKPVKAQQVSEEFGVRYVLEGSVQKSGGRLRVSAQLIDAITGNLLWSESYDRNLEDIFTIQAEITMKVLGVLDVKLEYGEMARMMVKGTNNLEAYIKVLHGIDHFRHSNKEANAQAQQMGKEAIALDPAYAEAYRLLAWTHLFDIHLGSSKSPEESLAQAFEKSQKAIMLDDFDGPAHALLGQLYLMKRQYAKAIAEGEQAIELAPNSAQCLGYLSRVLHYAGKHEESIASLKKALRLDPIPPKRFLLMLGMNYMHLGKYEEAIEEFKKVLHSNPHDLLTNISLTAAYSLLGREEEARVAAAEVLKLNPEFSIKHITKKWPYKNQSDLDLIVSALRKVGLQ
jgi:adenylate cyclase